MVTQGGDEPPEAEAVNLSLSVWTPTADEAATSRALANELARASTPKAIREARRRIERFWSEMQQRHRDDPLRTSADPEAEQAHRALHREHLEKQLRELDEDSPSRDGPDPNQN